MRHLNSGRRLGVTTAHRNAMMRNLVTSVIEYGGIECTLARAKELRTPLEKMITLAKRGSLHHRRQAMEFVRTKRAISILFDDLAPRYQTRNGGYSRIIRLDKRRLGDGAELVCFRLVDGIGGQSDISPNKVLLSDVNAGI